MEEIMGNYTEDPILEDVYEDIVKLYPETKINPELFIEKFYKEYSDGVLIYYDDAMDFLKKYDPSLKNAIDLAKEQGLTVYNSIDLANNLISCMLYQIAKQRSNF